MTLRDWMTKAGDAGDPPTLVSLALFALVFVPMIFLAGMSGELIALVRDGLAGLPSEILMAGFTLVILGLMAIARVVHLLAGHERGGGA